MNLPMGARVSPTAGRARYPAALLRPLLALEYSAKALCPPRAFRNPDLDRVR